MKNLLGKIRKGLFLAILGGAITSGIGLEEIMKYKHMHKESYADEYIKLPVIENNYMEQSKQREDRGYNLFFCGLMIATAAGIGNAFIERGKK